MTDTKTVAVSESTHSRLREYKRDGETFEGAILRLLDGGRDAVGESEAREIAREEARGVVEDYRR